MAQSDGCGKSLRSSGHRTMVEAQEKHARKRCPATITVDEMDSQTKELSEFCGVLWREREVVERVLFKVLAQQLVLKSGHSRWLVAANTEIELAVNDLRVIEVVRSIKTLDSAAKARLNELLRAGASLDDAMKQVKMTSAQSVPTRFAWPIVDK